MANLETSPSGELGSGAPPRNSKIRTHASRHHFLNKKTERFRLEFAISGFLDLVPAIGLNRKDGKHVSNLFVPLGLFASFGFEPDCFFRNKQGPTLLRIRTDSPAVVVAYIWDYLEHGRDMALLKSRWGCLQRFPGGNNGDNKKGIKLSHI